MRRPDEFFPLDLSDFEYYACVDGTADYPMVMALRIHIEGPLNAEAFRASLREALYHHPLLRSVIEQVGPRAHWRLLPDAEPHLTCTFHDDEQPPTACPPVHLDISREAGSRFELRTGARRSVLIAWLHHACVDGVGGIQFLADVFARYGQKTADSAAARPVVVLPDPEVLLKRGIVPQLGGPNKEGKTWTEWLYGPLKFLLGRNYCIEPRTESAGQASDARRNILHTAVLPGPTVRQLKRLASSRQVSTNDLCMMAYLQQISSWTQGESTARDNDLFRILMPVSLRTPEHDRISAANVLSYVFQPFQRRDCRNPEALLAAIHRRSVSMIDGNEGAVLLRLFSVARRVPGLFRLSRRLQPSFATAVLANVGELKRVFGNRFPLKKGRVVAGNVVIQRIDGIAPLRKNTNIVISFGGYAGELILNLRASPDVMSDAEAETFLNQVVSRLITLAETQSLTGNAQSDGGTKQTPGHLISNRRTE
ncbi:MAG: hypothetical protein RIK87_03195 [Fuerstiella sp.]